MVYYVGTIPLGHRRVGVIREGKFEFMYGRCLNGVSLPTDNLIARCVGRYLHTTIPPRYGVPWFG